MARGNHTSSMNRMVEQFSRLPGIGKRSAERLAFHLLKQPDDEVMALSAAIADLKRSSRQCSVCFNLTDMDPCGICSDPQRNQGLVMVVEQPSDLLSIEQTGLYKGVYHVLMGRVAPLDGIEPGDLTIDALLQRVVDGRETSPGVERADGNENDGERPAIEEVIIGTNPTLEGDGTALYLVEKLDALGVTVSRLARGLPYGSNMEMVSKAVIADAMDGRQPMR